MEKCRNALYGAAKWASLVAFIVMVSICMIQVVCRYALHVSLPFTEELARYLFIWMTFLGSVMAVKGEKHVNMDLLYNYLPPALQKVFKTIIFLILIVTYTLMAYSGYVMTMATAKQTSPAMHLPMSFVYVAVFISSILMILLETFEFITFLKSKKGGDAA